MRQHMRQDRFRGTSVAECCDRFGRAILAEEPAVLMPVTLLLKECIEFISERSVTFSHDVSVKIRMLLPVAAA